MDCQKAGLFIAKCRTIEVYDGQFTVRLYNGCGDLIDTQITDKSGNAYFHILHSGEYSVCVTSKKLNPYSTCSLLYLCADRCYSKYFVFSDMITLPPTVTTTFYLVDANYADLPISQGVINLWHK